MEFIQLLDAFEHIKASCSQSLKELYPAGIPKEALERYQTEISFLERSQYIEDFEICRRLALEAEKCGSFFALRGTVSGSFLVSLLCHSPLNPLPAHYYCSSCGHFEMVDTHLAGIDLLVKPCRKCGEEMTSDGFHLPVESVWGTDGKKSISFEYDVSPEFMPAARKVLENLYPDNVLLPNRKLCENEDTHQLTLESCGFLILPSGYIIEDYPDLQNYLESGDLCLTENLYIPKQYGMKQISLFPDKFTHNLITMQKKTGIPVQKLNRCAIKNLRWEDLVATNMLSKRTQRIFQIMQPENFTDMTAVEGFAHSTYLEINPTDTSADWVTLTKFWQSKEFSAYRFCTREDVFDALLDLGYNRKDAFQLSEFIRKGKAASAYSPYVREFEQYTLPDLMKKTAGQCIYLFPRAHCATYVMLYAFLALYQVC